MHDLKLFFNDVETTGLTPAHGVIQMAGLIEVDGAIRDSFDYSPSPFPEDLIEESALAVNNRSMESIRAGRGPRIVHQDLVAKLARHVNKFDKADKLYFVAYNSPFDNGMMRAFFEKAGDTYFGSWFWNGDICVMRMAALHFMRTGRRPRDMKLTTVLEFLGLIEPGASDLAHEALWDIEQTRRLFWHLVNACPLPAPGELNP